MCVIGPLQATAALLAHRLTLRQHHELFFQPPLLSVSTLVSTPPSGVKAASLHPCAELTWIRTIVVWFSCFLWKAEKLHCVWFLEYSLCRTSGRARWAVRVWVFVCWCALCASVCARVQAHVCEAAAMPTRWGMVASQPQLFFLSF